ncbi:hypothetical protein ARHIZOSPH14_28850 [Agromyces rhizosphaerae]|uniref:Leucine-rich repeat domain-containing protein n=1 Tax=Agromyces rhizosphaerae TaxID=88374 RepID=A0A9W6D2X8_9MICO|nr:hypothetical protein [Agromyces rhizosphaerae]GLI28643.1 hypothetical protein ARHIZOSPH14_28850 [Agromyces rhizosphaerae]
MPGPPFFHRRGDLVIREAPADRVPVAVFEGRVPTPRERRQILRAGLGLHLVSVPREAAGLEFLRDFHGLTSLGIVGTGLDTRPIAAIGSLRELELTVPGAPETDLSSLPDLERYSGLLRGFETVLDAPALARASFSETWRGTLPKLPPSLTSLTLTGARNVSSIAADGPGPCLSELVIEGARRFDLGSLRGMSDLRILSLERIGLIRGAATLAALPIRELGIVDCRGFDEIDPLARIADAEVTVVGPLGGALRAVAERSTARWSFFRS